MLLPITAARAAASVMPSKPKPKYSVSPVRTTAPSSKPTDIVRSQSFALPGLPSGGPATIQSPSPVSNDSTPGSWRARRRPRRRPAPGSAQSLAYEIESSASGLRTPTGRSPTPPSRPTGPSARSMRRRCPGSSPSSRRPGTAPATGAARTSLLGSSHRCWCRCGRCADVRQRRPVVRADGVGFHEHEVPVGFCVVGETEPQRRGVLRRDAGEVDRPHQPLEADVAPVRVHVPVTVDRLERPRDARRPRRWRRRWRTAGTPLRAGGCSSG